MTDVVGNPEEERRAAFYHEPWSQEAVSRYFYCKVRERHRNLILHSTLPHPVLANTASQKDLEGLCFKHSPGLCCNCPFILYLNCFAPTSVAGVLFFIFPKLAS